MLITALYCWICNLSCELIEFTYFATNQPVTLLITIIMESLAYHKLSPDDYNVSLIQHHFQNCHSHCTAPHAVISHSSSSGDKFSLSSSLPFIQEGIPAGAGLSMRLPYLLGFASDFACFLIKAVLQLCNKTVKKWSSPTRTVPN